MIQRNNTDTGFIFSSLLWFCVFTLIAIGLSSCMSPGQQHVALEALDAMRAKGVITPEQYEAMREAILSSGFGSFWQQIGVTVLGAAATYAGIRLQRGPATKKDQLVEIITNQVLTKVAPKDDVKQNPLA